MGERKVLNKYIPADFDPSKISQYATKATFKKEKMFVVRMMLPMSVQCNTCGEYMYQGKKFNTKSERVEGEDYLGIRKVRFYFKCVGCGAGFVIKTDPKNSDYEVEGNGAKRTFEPWREKNAEADAKIREADSGEAPEEDAMTALENRTMESKRQMEVMDALDEIKSMKQKRSMVDPDAVLRALEKREADKGEEAVEAPLDDDKEDEEAAAAFAVKKFKRIDDGPDDALVGSSLFSAAAAAAAAAAAQAKVPKKPIIAVRKRRRIGGDSGVPVASRPKISSVSTPASAISTSASASAVSATTPATAPAPVQVARAAPTAAPPSPPPPARPQTGGLMGLADYGSSSDSSSDDSDS